MTIPGVIAIDGPAASGKSTVGIILARDLGYICLDTGIMYRAVTLAALDRGISISDEEAITSLAEMIRIDVFPPSIDDSRPFDVIVDGKDVTWDIRTPRVNANVSAVSAYRCVRAAMTLQQRRIGEGGKIVMLGRDIGTIVLPFADLKIYLDASVEERARRRYEEYKLMGMGVNYEEILESLKLRDQIDSTRAVAPLTIPEDAFVIDTDDMTIEEVVSKIKEIIYHV
jgi:cytidylate kinase